MVLYTHGGGEKQIELLIGYCTAVRDLEKIPNDLSRSLRRVMQHALRVL